MAEGPMRYYRPDELATGLGVSRKTVYAWIRQRRIIAFRVGSLLRIPSVEYAKIMDCGVPSQRKRIQDSTV
jgi:excisionase family DNA binding protein